MPPDILDLIGRILAKVPDLADFGLKLARDYCRPESIVLLRNNY